MSCKDSKCTWIEIKVITIPAKGYKLYRLQANLNLV
jgi:hypothetical protein